MRLVYHTAEGLNAFHDLKERSVVIGRSPEAEIRLVDDKVSRLHCGIRFVDGEYYLKDLGSRNGTFLNADRISTPSRIMVGDHIRVGTTILTVSSKLIKGTETILHEMEEEMELGKGYNTILREIVDPE